MTDYLIYGTLASAFVFNVMTAALQRTYIVHGPAEVSGDLDPDTAPFTAKFCMVMMAGLGMIGNVHALTAMSGKLLASLALGLALLAVAVVMGVVLGARAHAGRTPSKTPTR